MDPQKPCVTSLAKRRFPLSPELHSLFSPWRFVFLHNDPVPAGQAITLIPTDGVFGVEIKRLCVLHLWFAKTLADP